MQVRRIANTETAIGGFKRRQDCSHTSFAAFCACAASMNTASTAIRSAKRARHETSIEPETAPSAAAAAAASFVCAITLDAVTGVACINTCGQAYSKEGIESFLAEKRAACPAVCPLPTTSPRRLLSGSVLDPLTRQLLFRMDTLVVPFSTTMQLAEMQAIVRHDAETTLRCAVLEGTCPPAAHGTYTRLAQLALVEWSACIQTMLDRGWANPTHATWALQDVRDRMLDGLLAQRLLGATEHGLPHSVFDRELPFAGCALYGPDLPRHIDGVNFSGVLLSGPVRGVTMGSTTWTSAVFRDVSFQDTHFGAHCSFVNLLTVNSLRVHADCSMDTKEAREGNLAAALAARGFPSLDATGVFDPSSVPGCGPAMLIQHPNAFMAPELYIAAGAAAAHAAAV